MNNLDLVSSAPQQPVISDPFLGSQYSGQDETTSYTDDATARMPSLSMDYDNSQDDHLVESTHDGLVDDDTLSFGYYDDASEELSALSDLENNSSDNCNSDSKNDNDNISNNERPRIQCKNNNLDLHTPYKTSGHFVNNEDGTETCVYNDKSIYSG
ncbi:hypothetical protein HMPREF1544_06285 [Mucor circinelloides 1006PhL]|uniref:Uncharacterized protein n=1 Tax=Mucor circinelloides f. circinelloides (strain 1006PhL) TaxID=1220926 RepID=S2JES8_MUCC1|nr:hypothetical protein HMPREF1544_06285 [Mucor circinelloides 1006PhL]